MTDRDAQLPKRMKNFFSRQIAWYEQVLAELQGIEDDLKQADLTALTEHESQRAKSREQLEREFRALHREWEAAEAIPEQGCQEVQALADRAESLARRLAEAYDEAAQLAHVNRATASEYLRDLRKGRELLSHYRAGDAPKAEFLDKKI